MGLVERLHIDAGVVQYLRPMDGDIADMFHPEMIWVDVTACRAATSGWLDRRSSRWRLELRRADPARADGCRAWGDGHGSAPCAFVCR